MLNAELLLQHKRKAKISKVLARIGLTAASFYFRQQVLASKALALRVVWLEEENKTHSSIVSHWEEVGGDLQCS